MDDYLDILRDWEETVAKPFLYEHLDTLFPAYQFRRVDSGNPTRDHWASRYKRDLTLPKARTANKTVMYRSEMRLREQGDWDNSIGIMDFYMQEYRFNDVFKACLQLDEDYSLGMPRRDGAEYKKSVSERSRKEALLADLQQYFAWHLENNESLKASAVRRYLTKQRGFSKEQIVKLNLGFVPDWGIVIRYIVSKRGYTIEELEAACEVRNAEGKTAVGKSYVLAVPYTCAGVLKGFIFRKVGEGSGPKYIANKDLDRKSAFFNIAADSALKEIIVVEGEFDALKATAEGIPGVVAIGGADLSGERRSQVEDALYRRGVRKITLCLDLDSEKDNPSAAKREERFHHVMSSIHAIKDVDIDFDEIYVASFPSPMDPDECIRINGVDAFKKLLSEAVPYWKYIFDYKENR